MQSGLALPLVCACLGALADRTSASIPARSSDIANVGELGAAASVDGAARIGTISDRLLTDTLTTTPTDTFLPGFAGSLEWDDTTTSQLADVLDFVPDNPDKLLASVGDDALTNYAKVGRLMTTRSGTVDSPPLGSLTGSDTTSGPRPIGGDGSTDLGVGTVTRVTGSTSNRLETAPVPGAALLAALGIGLVGIARFRGWVS
ncbi:MAG: hypothetical protein PVI86_07055 [Phycisphaerae bacterium]